MGGKRIIHLVVLLSAVLLSGSMAAGANAVTIQADSTCCSFAGGPFIQAPGEQSVFEIPADGTFHNLTATANGPDGGLLFEAETINAGSSAPVAGSEYLGAGSYPFVCTLHPGMDGDLVVEGDGSPVARPSISLTVPAQKLKRVRKTGKVKVKVKAGSTAEGIIVRLASGKRKFSAPLKLSLKGGAARTVAIKLNATGRKAVKKVKKGKKLRISASGTVRYGKPAKTNRNLR